MAKTCYTNIAAIFSFESRGNDKFQVFSGHIQTSGEKSLNKHGHIATSLICCFIGDNLHPEKRQNRFIRNKIASFFKFQLWSHPKIWGRTNFGPQLHFQENCDPSSNKDNQRRSSMFTTKATTFKTFVPSQSLWTVLFDCSFPLESPCIQGSCKSCFGAFPSSMLSFSSNQVQALFQCALFIPKISNCHAVRSLFSKILPRTALPSQSLLSAN